MTDTTTTTTTNAPPANATEAGALLTTLQADAGWGQRVLAGDVATVKQFHELTEMMAGGETIDDIVAGVAPAHEGIGSGNVHEMTGAAEMLREAGIRDEVIKETLKGRPISAQEFRAVSELQARRHADREWTAKFLSGNPDARREQLLMNIVLSSEITTGA